MSGKTVAKTRRAGEQPVSSGIHRAAKRIGLEPAATGMMFHRAKLRCQLALALFEYRQEFGYVESANEVDVEVESAGVSS